MADESVVLDNVLCFLIARFGKSSNKQLKSVLLDFYNFEDLYRAKQHVLEAVDQLKSDINLPHIPSRREGEQRNVKSLDDILTVLTHLDENLKMDILPKYVAESPDAMPSMRLYDGDLVTLMLAFDKLKDRMDSVEGVVTAILGQVNIVRDKLLPTTVQSAVQSAPVVNSGQAQSFYSGLSSAINNVGVTHTKAHTTATETETELTGNLRQNTDRTSVDSVVRNWASAVETASTPIAVHNRYSVLRDHDDVENGNDSEQFTEQRSRRSVKRRRQQSRQQAQHQQQQQQTVDQSNHRNSERRPGRSLLTGKLKITAPGQRFTAAKNIVKKAVFCVDNVHPSVEVDDLRLYVTGLSVQVLTCFKAKPRRRRYESDESADRKAFRLCIAAADRERLLDESKWPESIVISEWYHINPTQRTNEQTVQRTVADIRRQAEDTAQTSGDNTVVYNTATEETTTDATSDADMDQPTSDHGDC